MMYIHHVKYYLCFDIRFGVAVKVRSRFLVTFIFEVIFIFVIIYIIIFVEDVFLFSVVFILVVVLIFEVVFIFKVIFIFYIVFILDVNLIFKVRIVFELGPYFWGCFHFCVKPRLRSKMFSMEKTLVLILLYYLGRGK